MEKLFLLSLTILLALSCGQKSTIESHVQAEKLQDEYTLTFPIDDPSLAYKTPIPGLAPIVGGVMKFVGDIFAKTTDMGKMQMSYTQPIPDVRDYLKSVRLKRVFFYMKPQDKQRRVREWYERVILGRGNTTFDFLDKLAIQMSTTNVSDPDKYVPTLVDKISDPKEVSALMKVFDKNARAPIVNAETAKELLLVRYTKQTRELDTRDGQYGQIHILETTGNPKDVKYFLKDQALMTGLYKRILIYDKSILVELINDPVANETFKEVMSQNADMIEQMGVNFVDTCSKDSCLELAVPEVNLVPIAIKGNSLKFDSILHADKVPESFKLKGFVEFDIKVNSPI